MIRTLPLLLLIFFISCNAQKKVKGNRNVETEERYLDDFHSLVIQGDFEAGIKKGSSGFIEIEADENLLSLIETNVINGVLHVKTSAEISNSKRLNLEIHVPQNLQSVIIKGSTELESLQDINTGELYLEAFDNAEFYMTLTASRFELLQHDGSKTRLNVTSKEANLHFFDSCDTEALINSALINVELSSKSDARIEGNVDDFNYKGNENSKFEGENLTCTNALVTTIDDAEIRLHVTDSLTINASGKSEIDIYGEPKIILESFTDEAVIAKKEFGKGLFQ